MNSEPAIWTASRLDELWDVNPPGPMGRGQLSCKIEMAALPVWRRKLPRRGPIVPYSGGARFANQNVLLARITPCLENGKAVVVDILEPGEIGHGSTEFIVIAGKPGCGDPLFAYYLVRDPAFRRYAIGHMTGSSGRQRVSADAVSAYVRPFPPYDEQRRIAGVLGALDSKIEANVRLEDCQLDAARALFSEVRRAAEERSVPPASLSELLTVNPKVKLPKGTPTPFIEMSAVEPWAVRPDVIGARPYSGGCRFEPEDTLIAKITGCIEYGKGAFADFVEGHAAGSTEFHVLRAGPRLTPETVFLISRDPAVRAHLMQNMTGSSGRQRVPPDAFSTCSLVVPENLSDWDRAATAIRELFASARSLWSERRELSSVRDALLPDLLSGRIQISCTFESEEQIGDLLASATPGPLAPADLAA